MIRYRHLCRVHIVIFFFFAFAMLPSRCRTATYYVDATNGSDSNSGTSENTPWKTISKVNGSQFQPGDFIMFKRGEVWHEQLSIPSSGTNGNPITFGAYASGNRPIIHGAPTRNYCIYVYERNYINIENIATCNSKNDGINFRGQVAHTTSHSHVTNCVSYNNSAHGFKVAQWEDQDVVTVSDITFTDCIAYDNDYYGFQASNGSGDVSYTNCESYNNTKHGFRFGTTQKGLISECLSYNNGTGLRIDDSNGLYPEGLTIERSIFRNNTTGLSIANGSNIVIKNNLIYDNIERGMSYVGVGEDSARIHNNTFCNNNTSNSIYHFNLFLGPETSNVIVKNNIFYNSNYDRPTLYVEPPSGTLTLDYNCFYNTYENNLIYWKGTSYSFGQFNTYQTVTGQDIHSMAQNPKFKDALNKDFSLDASSPCIDAGMIFDLTRDFKGTAVPQGAKLDIGAIEYSISSPKNLHIQNTLSTQ